MRKLTIVLPLMLAACGSFPLCCADRKPGQTDAELHADVASCKDEADSFSSHPGQQTGQFLLGATLIGYPLGYQWEKTMKQDAWSACMAQRGYRVSKTE